MLAWQLFYNPIPLAWDMQLWLLLPLCAGVAVVYKTLRITAVRHLPREILKLWAYMLAGLAALGAALWILSAYLT